MPPFFSSFKCKKWRIYIYIYIFRALAYSMCECVPWWMRARCCSSSSLCCICVWVAASAAATCFIHLKNLLSHILRLQRFILQSAFHFLLSRLLLNALAFDVFISCLLPFAPFITRKCIRPIVGFALKSGPKAYHGALFLCCGILVCCYFIYWICMLRNILSRICGKRYVKCIIALLWM